MRSALVVLIAACGNGASASDAGTAHDAHPLADAAPPPLAVTMLPSNVVTVPLNSRQMYEARVTGSEGKGTIAATLSDPAAFTITSRYCETSGVCIVDLELVPVAEGMIDGQLVLTSDTGETATAHMRANVVQPNVLAIAPDRIDFLGQGLGMTSAPLSATITNTGTVASGPIALALDNPSLFHLHAAGCLGQVLAAGASCAFTVDYTPVATTPLGSGGDFGNLSATATPGGVGVALALGYGLTLTIAPQGEVMLPDTVVGQTSAPRTFTIANALAVPIGPLATSLVHQGAAQFALAADACNGITLAAGASCTIGVAFAPTATGLHLEVLDVVAPDFGGYRNDTATMIYGTGL